MAGYLMAKCVFVRKGGMITKNLANAIDFLLDTDDPVDFDGDPFRTCDPFHMSSL